MDLEAITNTMMLAAIVAMPAALAGAVVIDRRARTRANVNAFLKAHDLEGATPLWRQTYTEMHDPTKRYLPVHKDDERYVVTLIQTSPALIDVLPQARVYSPVELRGRRLPRQYGNATA